MSRRAMHARLNRLSERPGVARPCKECGATLDAQGRIVGPVRWVVPPPRVLGEGEASGDTRERWGRTRSQLEFCAGCGRLMAARLASPFAGSVEGEA